MNVVIYRLPEKKSIVYPASSCPSCHTSLRWWMNIPVLSWLMLRGKCHYCSAPISMQYPFVELLTGLGTLGLWLYYGRHHMFFAVHVLLLWAFIALSIIDWNTQLLPDRITKPFIALGVLFSSIQYFHVPLGMPSMISSIIGAILGGSFFWLIGYIYKKKTGVYGLGGGDVKLLALIGAWTGWTGVYFAIFIGSVVGVIIGVPYVLKTGNKYVPYGPFLCLGAFIYLLFSAQLIAWI